MFICLLNFIYLILYFHMFIYIDVNVIVSLEETQVRKIFTFSTKSYCSVSWEWTLLKPSFICLKEIHQVLSRSCPHCFTFSQSFSRPCTGKLHTSLIIPWSGLDIFQILQQLIYETSQELRMLSKSLSDCKSLLLNVMIQVSQFVSNSQLCHYKVTNSLNHS